jgi:hypothetical protein
VPWELTRDESDGNCKPAHTACHKAKTVTDVQGIRKADRIRRKHLGLWPKSPRPLRSRGFQKRATQERAG